MRVKSVMAAILTVVLLLTIATACTKEIPVMPENLIEVANGATTRGGFTVSKTTTGTRGWAFGAYPGDISEIGYIEEEFFIEGIAQRYEPIGELGKDGKWMLQASDTGRKSSQVQQCRNSMGESQPRHLRGRLLIRERT